MKVDFLIVGQGLAGSILAWELMQHEQRVLVIDSGRENSASRVAAGLINPITGQRLVKANEVDDCLPVALDCYQKLGQQFSQQFYFPLPMLRLFRCQAEQDRYQHRCRDIAYQAYLGRRFQPGESGEPINDVHGGFEQHHTGYVDITTLLVTLREHLQQHEAYLSASFDYQELQFRDKSVQWRNYQADFVVFCEGSGALDNPWFRWLPFQLCKGDIITVESHKTVPAKLINDGHWLLPISRQRAKVGATYEWQWHDDQPSEVAGQILLRAYQQLTGDTQFSIVDHQSGLRPTTKDKHPFLGRHAERKHLAIFNGFGSKGALTIPYYAVRLVETLLHNKPVPANTDINRFDLGISMVTLAKRFVSDHINEGDVAVDATIGNGYDTEFLARCVGAEGQVYGFDIQQQAISNTQHRIAGCGLASRVTLYCAAHESMNDFIEPDLHGKIAAVVFNLGYLPGDDKSIQTQMLSTLKALQQALSLLKVGGIVSIVTYSGHAEGQREASEIRNWLQQLNNNAIKFEFVSANKDILNAPSLIKIIKQCEFHQFDDDQAY